MSTFIISAPYNDKDKNYSLADFNLPENLKKFEVQGGKIFIYHSKDDPVVDFADFEKYKKALPNAQTRVFTDRGHFNQEFFPELVADVKSEFK